MTMASLTLAQANKIVEAALADARRLKIKRAWPCSTLPAT
jgi:hypothetical protein